MKKNQKQHRKLRKCERGIKTKSFNKGARYIMTNRGFVAVNIFTRNIYW